MEETKVKAVPMTPGVRVEVTWKGGAQQHLALAQEEIESGDLLMLSGPFEGRCIQLMGTDAHGVKKYNEVDAPKKDKDGAFIGVKVTPVPDASASVVEQLMGGLKFPEPGPSKPLIGDDGQPLPPPTSTAPAVIVPPAPTP